MSAESPYKASTYGLSTLLSTWVYSAVAIMSVYICSMFITKQWLPIEVLAASLWMMIRSRMQRNVAVETCNMLSAVMAFALFVTAAVMIIINIYYLKFIDPQEYVLGTANKRIPYVVSLVMMPSIFFVTLGAYILKPRLPICRGCARSYDNPGSRDYLPMMLTKETNYQLRLLVIISSGLTIYSYIYYFSNYCNINYSVTDRVWYIYTPLVVLLLTCIFLARRYKVLLSFYSDNIVGDAVNSTSSKLRYLIVCGDLVYLNDPETDDKAIRIDTPAIAKIPFKEEVTMTNAIDRFVALSGCKASDFDLRFLYENSNPLVDTNMYHYLCTVENKNIINTSRIRGRWHTLPQLTSIIEHGMASKLLVHEYNRIRTIVLAHKTYDRQGMRRYNIKHYMPSFRLRDLQGMKVDFNDPIWLTIADYNEDHRFFKIRRFFRKHFKGYDF